MPIFMINLERSPERRARAENAFGAASVELIFHPGIDGAQAELRHSPDYDRATRLARYGGDLNSREIGCYLSHLSVMQRCLDQGIARAIIMEDDVIPQRGLRPALAKLAALPDCFELVRLYGLRPRRSLPICDLGDSLSLTWPTHGMCGAQGYYLTAPAMRKFLALGKVLMPYDVMLDRHWESGVPIFALEPFVIGINELSAASNIGARADLWADGSHQILHAKLKLGKLADRGARALANAKWRLELPKWRRRAREAFSGAPVP